MEDQATFPHEGDIVRFSLLEPDMGNRFFWIWPHIEETNALQEVVLHHKKKPPSFDEGLNFLVSPPRKERLTIFRFN
jgi:hypothetical protein